MTKGVVVMKLRVPPVLLAAGILLFACFGLMSSCSDSPTGTNASVPMEGEGNVDPGAGGSFLLSNVDMGPDYQGYVEVWAYDLVVESDSIVAFDLVLINKTRSDIAPPLHFVITSIVPSTVTCFNPDGYLRGPVPYFDFSDDMGGDELLTPGEATAPVHARFRWFEPTAFSIGFRLVIGEVIPRGMIAGVVFDDINENGVQETWEPGIAGTAVRLRGAQEDSVANVAYVVVSTDREGRYAFTDLEAGMYEVEALLLLGVRPTTPNPLLIALVELPGGNVSSFLAAHFGMAAVVPPPVFVFGPVPVGPGGPQGTRVDSTFAIPPPMPPVPPFADLYFVRVDPPPIMGPYPMFIEKVTVAIDDHIVYKFECPPDTLCPPRPESVLVDAALLMEGEHAISIEVLGSERAFLLVGIEHNSEWDTGFAGQRP